MKRRDFLAASAIVPGLMSVDQVAISDRTVIICKVRGKLPYNNLVKMRDSLRSSFGTMRVVVCDESVELSFRESNE